MRDSVFLWCRNEAYVLDVTELQGDKELQEAGEADSRIWTNDQLNQRSHLSFRSRHTLKNASPYKSVGPSLANPMGSGGEPY